jgi:hypothetical protein
MIFSKGTIFVMSLARALCKIVAAGSILWVSWINAAATGMAEPTPPARLIGKVQDATGRPLSGARVSISQRADEPASPDRITALTGKDGTFALPLSVPSGKPFVVREVWVEKSGFVRAENHDRHELKAGATAALDFRLERGEALAGHVEVPLSLKERNAGIEITDRQFKLIVSSQSFQQTHLTAKGGNFKLWAPRGDYSIEVRALGSAVVLVKPTKVKSGSRSLVLRNQFLSEQELRKAFDAFWEEMDRKYSYFFLKKEVDWNALKERYRPEAIQAVGLYEFAEVLADMLGHLEDQHVWIATPEGRLSTHINPGRRNQNLKLTLSILENQTKCGDFAVVGKTRADGYGYFLMTKQSAATPETVRQAVKAIRDLQEAPGFMVDLREANGGNELLAREIAGLFCGKQTVYAKSKFRSGKKHDEFGQVFERVLPASNRPYLMPVVCLLGQRCVSSGEGFAQMMKCLPQVTTVGERTRGASGNPGSFRLPGVDVTVWFSRWVDLMPDGSTFEGEGIAPEAVVEQPPEAYQDGDPTLDKALEVLRQKVWDSKK